MNYPAHRATIAADRFLACLDDRQRAEISIDLTPRNMRAWSNLPQRTLGSTSRPGLSTSSLSRDQWAVLLELLSTVTGSHAGSGIDRLRDHLDTDDHLLAQGGRWGYGRGEFVVAILGTVGLENVWQLQFGGHHLALVRTFSDGRLVASTPSFRGIEPFDGFDLDGRRVDPERSLRHSASALLSSLDDDQAASARLSRPASDLLLGAGDDGPFPRRPAGIRARDLGVRQRGLLLDLVEVFVHDTDDASASQILADYRTQLLDTHLAWSGPRDLSRAGAYLRIDGPRVWIEISQHKGIVLPGAHPHAVWRDKTHDYGRAA